MVMKAVKEITVWKGVDYRTPNHVYLLDGDKIIAYQKWGEGLPEYLKNPIKIDRRGRKFVELATHPFDTTPAEQPSFIVRVKGSKGNEYEVNTEEHTCTCPGFVFRGNCRHVKELVNE